MIDADVERAIRTEREKCAKLSEGRAMLHRVEHRVKQAEEAFAIAAAIRSRSVYPDDGLPAKRRRVTAVR